jgi:hypothetical protein
MEAIDRKHLLPRSGVGVIGPHLVIAPEGQRVIMVVDGVRRNHVNLCE